MFEGYRIVCVTPAGRRRYLKTLIPYILREPIVDEFRLWRNTSNPLDIAFIRACTSLDPRLKVIEPPEFEPDGNNSIGQFFRDCADPKTIYIRFDDDIVHVEDGFFPALLRFRIDHPEYFLISPLVVNNPLCAYIMVTLGTIVLRGAQLSANAFDPTSWQTAEFAKTMHRAFFDAIDTGRRRHWRFSFREIALNRFGINCISWLGRDFAQFDGVVPFGDEEEWLSVEQPCRLGRRNCFFGGTSVVHFAYFPQRAELDRTDLLERYQRLAIDQLGRDAALSCHGFAVTAAIDPGLLVDRTWVASRGDGKQVGMLRFGADGELTMNNEVTPFRWTMDGEALIWLGENTEAIVRFDGWERDQVGRLGLQGAALAEPGRPDFILVELAA